MDDDEKPGLFLLPNVLGDVDRVERFLPIEVNEVVKTLDGVIAESEKSCRHFLKRFALKKKLQEMPIALLNEHTPDRDIDDLLAPILKGERWGLVSDAGLPCIADPGAPLVFRARERGIVVHAMVGPSSILLALMLSGLPGQRFSFRGYLERAPEERKKMIKTLAVASAKEKSTQIFIEAPYRNHHALKDLVETLDPQAYLCAAWDLTMPSQNVVSKRVRDWRKMELPDIDKKPVIFLFYCP